MTGVKTCALPILVVTETIVDIKAQLSKAGPVVVDNLIGPFADTALPTINACAPGSGYLDLSNGRAETAELLDLDGMAKATGRCLVSGAGWGVLAAESLVLKLCRDRPPAMRVRVDRSEEQTSELKSLMRISYAV